MNPDIFNKSVTSQIGHKSRDSVFQQSNQGRTSVGLSHSENKSALGIHKGVTNREGQFKSRGLLNLTKSEDRIRRKSTNIIASGQRVVPIQVSSIPREQALHIIDELRARNNAELLSILEEE